MRPADKELTQAVRALRDFPRSWGRWGVPGPVAKRADAIAGAAAHTQGPVRDGAALAPPTSPIGVASWQTFPPQPRASCSPFPRLRRCRPLAGLLYRGARWR